ncbi:MAG: toll/interleukin-1 receptor domain-containing protein [Anaerolineae bacterium]|nr:toll/interleukin-1 receptor domain-containing protein [Anaerolineae bacterium]
MPFKIFISYSHKDTKFATQFVADLRQNVDSVWFDTNDDSIRAGHKWEREIEQGIRNSDTFILLVSHNSLASDVCRAEFQFALNLGSERAKKGESKLLIIPVLLTNCEPEFWLQLHPLQYVDFRSDYSGGFRKLLASLASVQPLPATKKCFVCATVSETDNAHCPKCGAVYQPSRLGELYGLSPVAMQNYLKHYQPRTTIPNASIDDLLTVALCHLMMRSFDIAIGLLEQIVQREPTHAYGWYALALANLRGRRPRLLNRDEAIVIKEQTLNGLDRDATQAHIALFLALIKDDYFRGKGFQIENPKISDCLALAAKGLTTKAEVKALLDLIPKFDNEIVLLLLKMEENHER